MTTSWVALFIVGVATLVFGAVVLVLPSPDAGYLRSIGVAAIGMGGFGAVVTATAFRRRERWAFAILCYYPVFWTLHLVLNLPPGRDHVHQVVFVAMSLGGLLLAASEFFGPSAAGPNDEGPRAARGDPRSAEGRHRVVSSN